ncbi:class I SAM-dependent methyltransferase [Pilimelia columellifera]|uniref:Class I SAM-dependent methyltransferase n=1 Tax=Pilimelia columellifera subsp. columellifera TaxID=706583 RepID=A0ABP6API3_9ACTN
MDLDQLTALRAGAGTAALATADQLVDTDQLAAASALRAAGIAPDLAAAALTQARLRHRAAGKFGSDAAAMLFTRAGLEQATRRVVADRRALRLRDAGVRTLIDLGSGLGADSLAAARAGIQVHAVEADPVTAAVARHNVEALGLAERVTVRCADATTVKLDGYDAAFCDPARRSGAAGRRVFDPRAYSPPWDFVTSLIDRVPVVALKVAPGIDHALIPAGAEAEWVSVGGDLVEAAFWCGPVARAPRRASVLTDARVAELTGDGVSAAPVTGVGPYLFDPDPAVVRAHLVAEFATTVGGGLADERIAYVYADAPTATPFAQRFAVTDVLPFSLKRLRALLRERGVGRVEIRKRGSALTPETLRKQLKLNGDGSASLALTRIGDDPFVLICQPVPR